jgi:hypothetical protein
MAKHKKTTVNLDNPYEANTIGLSGIVYFSGGLFLLIVVTFGLMWFMLGVMENDAVAEKRSANPLELTKEEALPPEPRLQAAPGFGVETKNGFKKLELGAPQAEYRELLSQWNELWEKGTKDEKTGTVISLPINEAKRRLLAQSVGSVEKSSTDESRMMMSDSSAGRTASVRVR